MTAAADAAPAAGPVPIRVLDVGTQVAGPFVATVLGELGAEVIKCEQPGGGDPVRLGGMSARWQVEGRNKRSITLDLRRAEGQDLLRRLACWADVLVENFRPGTMARWGLDAESLRALNPRLVYVSISGFGQSGPLASRPAYHNIGAAFGGLSALSGFAGEPPVTPGPFLTDYLAGLFGAVGALAAVYRRDRPDGTGIGASVDGSLAEAALRIVGPELAEWSLTGVARERDDTPPYRTRDGRWLTLIAVQHHHQLALADATGDPRLADTRFTGPDRRTHRVELAQLVQAWTATVDAEDALRRLVDAGVPAALVNTVEDLAADPHLAGRGAIVSHTDAHGRQVLTPAPTPRIDATSNGAGTPGEPLGASNDYVYRDVLGLTADEVDALVEKGVITR
jgi:crotonobetainyl-CoA:carnitine CoA-transferase CaiB-like acyl-CoA transferase